LGGRSLGSPPGLASRHWRIVRRPVTTERGIVASAALLDRWVDLRQRPEEHVDPVVAFIHGGRRGQREVLVERVVVRYTGRCRDSQSSRTDASQRVRIAVWIGPGGRAHHGGIFGRAARAVAVLMRKRWVVVVVTDSC